MINLENSSHDLKSDLHNIFLLLNFVKEDNEVKDPEILKMLNKCLERKTRMLNAIDGLTPKVKG